MYAAKNYHNPKCIDEEVFFDDLKRFGYVSRLLNRYEGTGELSERLVLNHLIVIFNVFGIESGIEMLAIKIDLRHWNALKAYLIFLKIIKNSEITGISLDDNVVNKLRELR